MGRAEKTFYLLVVVFFAIPAFAAYLVFLLVPMTLCLLRALGLEV